ncbi:MAG: hypothetical protein HOO96_30155 [Polyangiaceae bacterium]|nr:hypothetical protein [Polyangiaceae bacterium]
MGFFDKFFKTKQTASPPPPPPVPPSLGLPCGATVASYEVGDGVGLLQLDSGESIRFGRSSCRGFEPVVETRVVVTEVAPHPRGGLRAKSVSLDPNDTGYDLRLAERDAKLGQKKAGTLSAEAAASTCRGLGWITVLLNEHVPEGPQALQRWLQQFDLAAAGITATTEAGLSFKVGTQTVTTYVGNQPFPREHLDLRQVGEDFSTGSAFLGLNIGEPTLLRASRSMGSYPDMWGPSGSMRELSRLVVALLARGSAVILNRAGDLVVDGASFVRMLGDLNDPECRPFGAWLVAIASDPNVYATFGMAAFGFPDVFVPVEPSSSWIRSRCHEAVLYAAYRMIRENRELKEGDVLRVPIGLRVGAWPVGTINGDAMEYSMTAREGMLALRPAATSVDPASMWAAASSKANPDLIAPNTYQAYFGGQLSELYPSHVVSEIPCEDPDELPHSVQVRECHDRPGYLIVTNGFGRLVQRGDDKASAPHAELLAWVDTYDFDLVSLVGRLGTIMHSPDPDSAAWNPGDTLAASLPELGIGGIVLANGGSVPMPGGAPVTVLMMIPMNDEEYDRVRGGGAAAWLAENFEAEDKRALLPARWHSLLH